MAVRPWRESSARRGLVGILSVELSCGSGAPNRGSGYGWLVLWSGVGLISVEGSVFGVSVRKPGSLSRCNGFSLSGWQPELGVWRRAVVL